MGVPTAVRSVMNTNFNREQSADFRLNQRNAVRKTNYQKELDTPFVPSTLEELNDYEVIKFCSIRFLIFKFKM